MQDKKRIMDMVKEGRITAEEAIRLLEAMDSSASKTASSGYAAVVAPPPPKASPR